MRAVFAAAVVAAAATVAPAHRDTPPPAAADRFERRVRPLLVDACVPCHGPATAQAGLRLDRPISAESARKVAAAVRHDGALKMPPSGKLPDAQIAELSAWAAAGAPWPATAAPAKPAAPLWSLRPVRRPAVPKVPDPAWARNPVDAFVFERLAKAGMRPAPEADRRTLIRRATVDVTGLMPTPEEVDAFLADTGPGAWERVVDRLLASPAYGERWGRHWLDLVRYADTKGYIYTGEKRYPFAWTYRDWVIDALNRDLPYDQFLLKQIAADRLPRADDTDLAALGFFTVGRRFVNNVPDVVDDRIDVLTRTTMGLTVTCARCHDHKFDPIPTTDYYALYQVLASSTERSVPIARTAPDPKGAYATELRVRQQAVEDAFQKARAETAARMRRQVDLYLAQVPDVATLPGNDFYVILAPDDVNPALVRQWKAYLDTRAHDTDPVFSAWGIYARLDPAHFARDARSVRLPATLHPKVAAAFADPPGSMREVAARYGALLKAATPADPALWEVLTGPDSPTIVPNVSIDEVEFLFNHATREELQNLKGKVDQWYCDAPDTPAHALALVELPAARPQHVYRRGDPRLLGPEVQPHFLSAVGPSAGKALKGGAGRRALARAIVDPANPLTARVAVNRLWMHHFGEGLVRTPSDFGTRGAPPTHPELLDWLASEFVRSGWSQKRLHRILLLSRTYRQGADADPKARRLDPENRLVGRREPQRLDLEALRDCLLQASGELDRTRGGRSVPLFQDDTHRRRTVYGALDRQNVDGPYRVFDFANPDQHTPRRHTTTVPQQALYLVNSPFAAARATALARRCAPPGRGDRAIVDALYQALWQRPPTDPERALATAFLAQERGIASGSGPKDGALDPVGRLAQALMISNGFCYVD